ncbi:MAG: TIR domain-containing protein, partial [Bryobacteraceae bacterium]
MHKPRLFVGSSKEAITIARAIQYQLREDAAVTIWNEDPTFLGTNTLNWLVHGLASYDFAVMVFTPDDTLISRGGQTGAVRDNILFELGLFMSRLGAERTYVVYDSDSDAQVKIPSDLKAIG